MYGFSRRAFLKGLGKVTAALGIGLSLGTETSYAKEKSERRIKKMTAE
jgi:hypothetical protein